MREVLRLRPCFPAPLRMTKVGGTALALAATRKPIAVRQLIGNNLPTRCPLTDISKSEREPSLLALIKSHAFILFFGMLGIMWAVVILDLLPFFHLDRHGIHPRSAAGLPGIVFCSVPPCRLRPRDGQFDSFPCSRGHHSLERSPGLLEGDPLRGAGRRVGRLVDAADKYTNHIGASGLSSSADTFGFLLARGIIRAVTLMDGRGGGDSDCLREHPLWDAAAPHARARVLAGASIRVSRRGVGAARAMFPGDKAVLRKNAQPDLRLSKARQRHSPFEHGLAPTGNDRVIA